MKRYLKTKMRKFSMNKAEKKTEIPPIPEPPTPEIDESKPSFYLGRLPQFVCPSLVILSVELPKQKSVFAKRVYGSGFIYYSDPNFSIVWGVSRFLEQKEKENLRRGEVNVRVNAGNGDSFPGTVLHVDFEHHLVVVKIYCGKQPTATLAPLDPLPSQLLCYDFMPMIPMYEGYNNTPRFPPQFEPCGYSLHLDKQFLTHMTGVVLNDHRDIIGLKTGDCKVHSDYAIVLPVEKLEQCLSSVTARFMDTHNDADFRTQFGDEPASTSDDTLPKEEEPFNIYGLTDEQKAIRLLFLENQPCNFVSGFVFGK